MSSQSSVAAPFVSMVSCRSPNLRLLLVLFLGVDAAWYDGIGSVKVITPGDPGAQAMLDAIAASQKDVNATPWQDGALGQFNDKRYAVLLTSGYHNLSVEVGYYTSLAGVGNSPAAVSVEHVQSLDDWGGYATCNFMRSVEGLTIKQDSIWAASQAAPNRRTIWNGDLNLTETGPGGDHWASGGFIADVHVKGHLHMGIQQQHLVRNSIIGLEPVTYSGWNQVFVGTEGAPVRGTELNEEGTYIASGYQITNVADAPRTAEKPYIVEDAGRWSIVVPQIVDVPSSGVTENHVASCETTLDLDTDVFIARSDEHNVSDINKHTEGKKGLLLTPGIYYADEPLRISSSDFIVLGIGFPTLVSTSGRSAVYVADNLVGVRIAGLLLETGTASNYSEVTAPLFQWGSRTSSAHSTRSALHDVFGRVGAFKYSTWFKPSCLTTRSDIMMELNAGGVIVDNTWLWHADHDDCGPPGVPSDECKSGLGLVVNADDVLIYGLKVEHFKGEGLVKWTGNGGQVFLFQSELPYHYHDFGRKGEVAYIVDRGVTSHNAYGVGVYTIGEHINVTSAIKAPQAATFLHIVTATIGGRLEQFGSMVCGHEGQCVKPSWNISFLAYLEVYPADVNESDGDVTFSSSFKLSASVWLFLCMVISSMGSLLMNRSMASV